MYNILLFDLDDTLLDFQKSESRALEKVFTTFRIPYTDEHISKYKAINHQLWIDFESGKIERDIIFETRFPRFLADYNHHVKGIEVDLLYRSYLSEGHDIKDGAIGLLNALKAKGRRLFAVTNGLLEMQQKRLIASGLIEYFEQVFISEETGYKKPDIEFFDYVFTRIPNFDIEKTVIIGDMLHADILGGVNAGIDTIWINERGYLKYVDVKPTYEVNSLNELTKLLLKG